MCLPLEWWCLAVTDSIFILRCPYCSIGFDFLSLTAHEDGLFICEQCGHTVRPDDPHYACLCRNCLKEKKT